MGYNRKQITGKLKRKFDEFIESITDKELRDDVAKNSIITGGAITSLLLGEKVNDYDIYFTNADTAYNVAKYYLNLIKVDHPFHAKTSIVKGLDRIIVVIQSSGVIGDVPDPNVEIDDEANDIEDTKVNPTTKKGSMYAPLYISSNAITLSGKIQLIVRFFGTPEDIHKNFDFVHATCYWVSETNELVLPSIAVESTLSREIIYRGSLYPLASVFRTKKFVQRGWKINAGQYLKMCLQVSKLDLNNIAVLREQLVGVDASYFLLMIEDIEKANQNGTEITDNYLMELIERMFG